MRLFRYTRKKGGFYTCDSKKTINGCIEDYIKDNNFIRIETIDDGNCFFDTISKFYEFNNIHKSHSELREELIAYIYNNIELVSPFLISSGNILNSVEELSEDGHWSSELGDSVPSIATNAFHIEIIIHDIRKKRGNIPRHIQIIKLEPEYSRKKYTIHMLRNINHYELLIPAYSNNNMRTIRNTNKNNNKNINNIIKLYNRLSVHSRRR